ncbi:MAG: hypothetical protein D6780_04720, partial [Candidatus Dadabacteria bacterium]
AFSFKDAFLALLFLILMPPFFVWSSSGMETMLYTYLLFALYRALFFNKSNAAIAVLVLALLTVRFESIAWIAGYAFLYRFFNRDYRKEKLLFFILFSISSFFLLELWRIFYFKDIMPNTAYAKTGFSLLLLKRGLNYIIVFLLTFPVTFLLFPAALKLLKEKKSFRLWPPFLIALSFWGYSVAVGGDFMTMGRFLVPSLPFLAIIFVYYFRTPVKKVFLSLLIFLSFLPAFNKGVVPRKVLKKFHFRWNNKFFRTEYEQWQYMRRNTYRWTVLGNFLKERYKPEDSLVRGAIGAVGYFSGMKLYDKAGLTNRFVSKRELPKRLRSPGHDKSVDESYFLRYKPTLLSVNIYLVKPKIKKKIKQFFDKGQVHYNDLV